MGHENVGGVRQIGAELYPPPCPHGMGVLECWSVVWLVFCCFTGPTPRSGSGGSQTPSVNHPPPLWVPKSRQNGPRRPKDGSREPRRPQRSLQDGPRWLLRPLGRRKMLRRRSQRVPRRFRTGPRRAKMLKILKFFYDFQDFSFLCPGGSKRAQDVLKTAEDGPKRAPRGPKMAPRGL